jgi:hypothetical protein
MAPALQGFVNMELNLGCAGEPGWTEVAVSELVWRSDGDKRGEEKERR